MSFRNTIENVQSGLYLNSPTAGFPGALAFLSAVTANTFESYIVKREGDDNGIAMGYLAQFNSANDNSLTPGAQFRVSVPTVNLPAGLVGIAIRWWLPTDNVDNTNFGTPITNQQLAGYIENRPGSFLPLGRSVVVNVSIPLGESVDFGQDVFTPFATTNDASDAARGSITSTSGTGLMQVPNAIFVDKLTATAENNVVRIKL